jgi:hypothetical protein
MISQDQHWRCDHKKEVATAIRLRRDIVTLMDRRPVAWSNLVLVSRRDPKAMAVTALLIFGAIMGFLTPRSHMVRVRQPPDLDRRQH